MLVLVLVALVACSRSPNPNARISIITTGGPVGVSVEVADTNAERAQGLSGRAELGSADGMAFLFDGPTTGRFWMKDTTIPLSIAFWDSSRRIVRIIQMAPCGTEPCPTYRPPVPYVGALEVNRGFFEQHGVKVGDRIAIHT